MNVDKHWVIRFAPKTFGSLGEAINYANQMGIKFDNGQDVQGELDVNGCKLLVELTEEDV